MPDIPNLGSDEWRYWVIGKLADIERGAIADADIAAIIGTNGSKTRIAINQMIADGDAAVTEALTGAIAASAQSTGVAANRYADVVANNALRDAKKYTDEHSGSGGVSQAYVDEHDATTLASSKAYTDATHITIRSEFQSYTDASSGNALSTSKGYADTGDAATLAAAKAYTDAHSGSGGGVSEQFVRDAVEQGVSDANTSAVQGDQAVSDSMTTLINQTATTNLQSANQYTDNSVAASASDVAGQAQTMANTAEANAKSYSDDGDDMLATNLSASFDVKVATGVADSKAYTDQKIAQIPGGGVSQSYVDTGDANTLSAAKTDAANKYVAKSDTNWVLMQPDAGATWTADGNLASRVKNELARLRGQVTLAATLAVGNNIGPVLPVGHRPLQAIAVNVGSTTSTYGAAVIRININGTFDILSVTGTPKSFRVDCIVFDVT